jgi:hypothetical protein
MKKILFLLTAAVLFTGCSKQKENTQQIKQISENSPDHEWYFFTPHGFEKTSLPQKSGISSLKPWTETLRASDANTGPDGKGYLVVNRLGVIFFDGDSSGVLMQDYSLFSNSTASTLIFDSGNPYITFSRSSFFNTNAALEETSSYDSNRPYLVRISSAMRSFYPVITYGDLNLSSGGEITGTHYDGSNFLCSVKLRKHEKTYFSYIKFSSEEHLETLAPYTVKGKLKLEDSSEAAYRKVNSPSPFRQAPLRLKKLLSSIPDNFDFAVRCKNNGGSSDRLYTSNFDSDGISAAFAIISDGWICAVFEDGTTYFNGALENQNIVNKGKNMAFRLPKLPENYIYGPFCISGNKLAVAWEESDFYKTGRSGFLVVDLNRVLYER